MEMYRLVYGLKVWYILTFRIVEAGVTDKHKGNKQRFITQHHYGFLPHYNSTEFLAIALYEAMMTIIYTTQNGKNTLWMFTQYPTFYQNHRRRLRVSKEPLNPKH